MIQNRQSIYRILSILFVTLLITLISPILHVSSSPINDEDTASTEISSNTDVHDISSNEENRVDETSVKQVAVSSASSQDYQNHSETAINYGVSEPSSNGFSFLGFSIFPGILMQPTNQNVLLSDNSLKVYARFAPSHYLNQIIATKEHWELYMSTDGENYKKVDSSSTSSMFFLNQTYDKNLTFKTLGINNVGTYYFQFKIRTPSLTGLFSISTYYSQIFTVNVVRDEVKATSLSIDQGNEGEMLKNDEKTLSATLNPVNSTDEILWTSSDNSIATIDNKGTIHAYRTGITAITASAINRSGGKDAQTTYKLHVTGGLDNLTVYEGESAEFKIQGLHSDVTYKTIWYQQKEDKPSSEDVVLTTNNEQTVTDKGLKFQTVTSKLDGTKYYAKIQAFIVLEDDHGNPTGTEKPAGNPFFTDTAILTVQPKLKISSVSDMNFGTLKLTGDSNKKHYPIEQNINIQNTAKKNWSLMVRQDQALTDGRGVEIPLYFQRDRINSDFIMVGQKNDFRVTRTGNIDTLSFKNDEGFNLSIPANATIGSCRSTMEWQLADAPN